jgi:hypothetical protein
MSLYDIASIAKIALWSGILIITYTSINVYEDPIVGIALAFLWIFIVAWGGSFYLFQGIQKIFSKKDKLSREKESYKLSLLFGIYAVINFLLIVLTWRTKFLGIILLIVFVRINISLFSKEKPNEQAPR